MLHRISLLLLLISLNCFAAGTAGLTYETFRAPPGPSPSISPLTYPTVLSTGISSTINYPAGSFGATILGSGRADYVIVHWFGYINIPTTGTYTFGGNSDDGIIIKVNNTTVLNGWFDSGGAFKTGTAIELSAGVVPIEVWYYENGGGQMVNLQWYLNNSWQIVGSTYLATDSTYFAPVTPTYSSSITTEQQNRKTSETIQRTSQSGNLIYIEQIGDNNDVTLRQGITLTGKNRLELYLYGDSNTLNLNQGKNLDGTSPVADSNNHYQYMYVNGNYNNVTTKQVDSSNVSTGNFLESTITGNSNTINLTQQGNSSKTLFLNVNGGSNTVTTNQKDTGQHYLDVKLTGNGHTVNTIQEGTGNHAATIDFTNSGGASSLNLNQSGSTNQVYSIQQSCTNPAGCSTVVSQP